MTLILKDSQQLSDPTLGEFPLQVLDQKMLEDLAVQALCTPSLAAPLALDALAQVLIELRWLKAPRKDLKSKRRRRYLRKYALQVARLLTPHAQLDELRLGHAAFQELERRIKQALQKTTLAMMDFGTVLQRDFTTRVEMVAKNVEEALRSGLRTANEEQYDVDLDSIEVSEAELKDGQINVMVSARSRSSRFETISVDIKGGLGID